MHIGLIGGIGPAATDFYYRRLISTFASKQAALVLNEMLAEPFQTFTFSPVGASVYQLGSFGAARKELQALSLTP
jgi:aspartate/glutamate racemase